MVVLQSTFREVGEAREHLLHSQKKLYSPEGIRAFKRRQRARQSSPLPREKERTSPKDEEEKTERLKREFAKAMGW